MLVGGFVSVLSLKILFLIFIGVVVGIIFGAIPGLSAAMAVALCLPLTFGMSAIEGIAMLVGLYTGGVSGGLISAILINIPGTPASIATCFDGHPLAKRGEAGKALGVGIVFSFIGGTLGILALLFIAPSLAQLTLKFGPIEYFAVTIFSLTMISTLSSGSLVKGLISGTIGIAISLVGGSPIDNVPRYTFGNHSLDIGFNLLAVMIGTFAVSEILSAARNKQDIAQNNVTKFKIKGFGFSMKEFKSQIVNCLRSSAIGTVIGILPGIGGGTANLISYSVAKNNSKEPEKFGTGIIDGIVASESANNAVIGGAMIPLLTLGIPGDAVTAMMIGGFMIHGISPGPMLFKTEGVLVYGIFAALILANIFFLVVQFYGLRGFVKLLSIKKSILLPVVMTLCVVGAFGANNRLFDVIALAFFGAFGYIMEKMEFSTAPLILGFILGPMAELNLRKGLMYTNGSFLEFFTQPIALLFFAITIISVIVSVRKEILRYQRSKKSNEMVRTN